MWIKDLETATKAVIEFLGDRRAFVCFDKVKPCADGGIVFETTYETYIKWFQNGEVVEKSLQAWRQR
jgi:hypothetical protein